MTTTDYSISKAQHIAALFGAQSPEEYLYKFVEGILIMADATVPSGFGGQVVGEEIYRLPLKISGRQKGLLREAIYLSRARVEELENTLDIHLKADMCTQHEVKEGNCEG